MHALSADVNEAWDGPGAPRRGLQFSAEALHHSLVALLGPRFPTDGRLWVAYSGGLDSSALLHASVTLFATRSREPIARELRAVHVDHGLSPESARWAAHCRRQCKRLRVPLVERRVQRLRQRGESLEAVAREARYAVFRELLLEGDMLATAQHRDDQAETLLLALLRGSGVHGLAAMPKRSRLGAGLLLRPLLGFSHADLEDYARSTGLAWLEDPGNTDPRFDRNRLRHQVLPLLRPRWPAFDATLARSAAHCAEAAELLDGLAGQLLASVGGTRAGTLSISGLTGLTGAHCRLVLRHWLVRQGFAIPDRNRLRRIIDELMAATADRAPLVAWQGCEVRRYRDDLYALTPLPPPPPSELIPLDSQRPIALPGALGRLRVPSTYAGRGALSVCFRRPGMRGRVVAGGVPHHSRSLKQLFQEAGVPAWIRPYVPLVLIDGELCAVAGLPPCNADLGSPSWEGHPWERFGLLNSG